MTRDIGQGLDVQARLHGTKGTDLDILRAPNRGPAGVLIAGVAALHLGIVWRPLDARTPATFQVRRRLADGYSGGLSYTFAKSMDNASSLGAGAPVVAQNDKDLESEWALSSFDRRHQVSGECSTSSCRGDRIGAG